MKLTIKIHDDCNSNIVGEISFVDTFTELNPYTALADKEYSLNAKDALSLLRAISSSVYCIPVIDHKDSVLSDCLSFLERMENSININSHT